MSEKSGQAEGPESTGISLTINPDLVHLAKQVEAAKEIIDAIDADGTRSIDGEIDNLTNLTLTLVDHSRESGGFTNSQPALTIAPLSSMPFSSRNSSLCWPKTPSAGPYAPLMAWDLRSRTLPYWPRGPGFPAVRTSQPAQLYAMQAQQPPGFTGRRRRTGRFVHRRATCRKTAALAPRTASR